MTDAPTILGQDKPTYSYFPPAAGTLGPSANDWLSQTFDVTLLPHQQEIIDRLLRVEAEGHPAFKEAGLLLRRQNAKSHTLVMYLLFRLFFTPRDPAKPHTPTLHLFSSLGQRTATELFTLLSDTIGRNAELSGMVHIIGGRGSESVKITDPRHPNRGDKIVFNVRSADSGRGFGNAATLVFDEAQSITEVSYNSLSKTTTTNPYAVTLYLGTVPNPDQDELEIFTAVRDIGRSGESATQGWIEWAPDGSWEHDTAQEIDPGSLDVFKAACPALGRLVTLDRMVADHERAVVQGMDAYKREALSIWPAPPPVESVKYNDLNLDVWERTTVDPLPLDYDGRWTLGLAVGRKTGLVSLYGCTRPTEDTPLYVEHFGQYLKGEEFETRLADLRGTLNVKSVVVDKKNAAYVESLKAIDHTAYDREVPLAYELFVETFNSEEGITHPPTMTDEETLDVVDDVLKRATTYSWGSKEDPKMNWTASDEDLPVEVIRAMTLAVYGHQDQNLKPKRQTYSRGY